MKFVDGGWVFLHLLEAIGLPKSSQAAMSALGMFFEILGHERPAGLVLLVERVAHPEPVGSGVGAGVVGVALDEIAEGLRGLHVFFGL